MHQKYKKKSLSFVIQNIQKNLVVLFLLFSLITTAQSKKNIRKEERKDDKKAKDLLNQVTNKIKKYENMIIDFKYTLNNTKENVNQDSKGTIIMKNNLYLLNFVGVIKLFDGKKIYTINPEDEEISISIYDEKSENVITPSKMLTFFNTGYKFDWDILKEFKGKKIQYIKLNPTNLKDQRKEILLGIELGTKNIYNIIEIGKNGTKTTLTISSFKSNMTLPPNQFNFDARKYPNYYINKLD